MKRLDLILIFLLLLAPVFGQSTSQDFPSPVLRGEISGTIPARDIGDARLTRHFYAFYAGVGDLFLKIETTNFNGDIDLFETKTFRPISKISIYNSDSAARTSRIVYFRQRIQVVMRVEGRTPNDEAASYRIDFSGSFAAAPDLPQPPEDLEPKTTGKVSSDAVARVNSAGAIIEDLEPKKQSEPVKTEPEKTENETAAETSAEKPVVTETPRRSASRQNTRPARRTVQPSKPEPSATNESTNTSPENAPVANPPTRNTRRPTSVRRNTRSSPARKETVTEPKVDPLTNLRLVVLLKDGYKIERPMSEILRASVDKGALVVVAKDGKIERFALLDVLKFSIEQ